MKMELLKSGKVNILNYFLVIIFLLDSQCVQTLDHPRGVWSVSVLDNGDLVTGCQDGVVRIWSQNTTRKADDALLASYQQEIIQSRVSR